MSPEGCSQRSSCEPFTATQAQGAPTPFPPPRAEGGGGQGKGGSLVLWEGECTCSLICSSSPLVWERRTTCWVALRVLDPKVLDLRRPPPFREGRDLAHDVPACSEGAKGVPGGLRRVSHQFGPASVGEGRGQQKVYSPVFWSPTRNQPTTCTLALWWLKFGPTEPKGWEGGGGGALRTPKWFYGTMSFVGFGGNLPN